MNQPPPYRPDRSLIGYMEHGGRGDKLFAALMYLIAFGQVAAFVLVVLAVVGVVR